MGLRGASLACVLLRSTVKSDNACKQCQIFEASHGKKFAIQLQLFPVRKFFNL